MRKPDVDAVALRRLLDTLFGRSAKITCRRTPDGVSTQVYRIRRAAQTFYLRVAESESASLAPEATLHTMLRARGVAVPEVVHYVPFDEGLGRSVLVTSEIPGRPMVQHGDNGRVLAVSLPDPAALADIYRAAGRDLARVNQVGVDGFGWIVRDGSGWPLRGEFRRYTEWVRPDAVVRQLHAIGMLRTTCEQVGGLLFEQVAEGPTGAAARLAHGDFDVSHVFHHRGRYAGIIDLGEVRGTEGSFDLAMFGLIHMPDRRNPASADQFSLLAAAARRPLEEGYAEVAPLPPDHPERMCRTAVMIVAQGLANAYEKRGEAVRVEPWFGRHVDRLHDLLAGRHPWANNEDS